MNKKIKLCNFFVVLVILVWLFLIAATGSENVNLTIAYSPEKPTLFEEIEFNAILDKEIDDDNVFFDWDLGDGFKVEGESIKHKYTQSGTFIVHLSLIRDDETKISSKILRVHVYGPKPKIDYFTAKPETIILGEKATLSWSVSNATSVNIDPFMEDLPLKGTKQVSPSKDITYTLSAKNPDWVMENWATVLVEPSPPKAVIEYSPSEPQLRQDITFDGSKSNDYDGEIVSYYWDFGEGYGSDKEVISHSFAIGDTHTVKLKVTDNDGAKGTSSVTVPVFNRNYWGRYFSTISDEREFFKGYYEGYLLQESKIPFIENGVSEILYNTYGDTRIPDGEELKLLEGWALVVRSIDIDSNKVYLELSRDGAVVDSKVVSPLNDGATEADKTYCYKSSGIITIAVHFKGVARNYVDIDYIWQISDAVKETSSIPVLMNEDHVWNILVS